MSATIAELMDAVSGWQEANGGGKPRSAAPTREELEALKAKYG